ncbi:phospholipase B1, membrane-associated-like [Salvelinus namaycush]|uniref:Phospholipase B1, membrane-associated-like n=1 Tax=Salvelinus namaycush TaxID=8040 RepID=A0A8U0PF02_SALNM|nr:phospholipase B1, membrane-associated-like [Salvelinus namaycush]
MKQVYNNFTYDRTKINCPSEDQPFIFTKVNSLPSPPVTTTTTPVPVTNTTTPSPVPRCDSSIPVWVPVLLGVTGLLIGWGITWLLMSCRERRNKRKMGEKEVEMKGTGF